MTVKPESKDGSCELLKKLLRFRRASMHLEIIYADPDADADEDPSSTNNHLMRKVTVQCHGEAGSIELPRRITVLDIKTQWSAALSVPVQKLVVRVSGCPPDFELKDSTVVGNGWIAYVHVKLNIVVNVGGTKHPIIAFKDSNGKEIKELVAQKIKNNGVLNMKLGLIDEDANNKLVSVGDDTPLYNIKDQGLKDGAEFVLE